MKSVVSLAALAAVIGLGVFSGNSLARAVENAGFVDALASKETVSVEIPAFVVSISTIRSPMEHVRAKMALKVYPKSMKDPAVNDRLADAVLFATSKAFTEAGAMDVGDKGAALIKRIASLANEKLGGSVVAELEVKNLAVFKSQRR